MTASYKEQQPEFKLLQRTLDKVAVVFAHSSLTSEDLSSTVVSRGGETFENM